MTVRRKDWSESEWPPMADKESQIRVSTASSEPECTGSFFQRLLSRRSTFTRKKVSNRIKNGRSAEMLNSIVIIPSPNTHTLLTKPFPRAESLGRIDPMGRNSDSRQRRTTGLPSLADSNLSKSELESASKENVTMCTDGKLNELSTEGCTPEWDQYVKCYSEGRFNLSNPPEPPSHKPSFLHFSAPNPIDEAIRLKALKSYNLPMTANAVEKCQRLVTLAKKVFQMKIGTISMIDEQKEILKIDSSIKRRFIQRHLSIGAHVLLSTEPMVILDTTKDWRFKENPIVNEFPDIRFYCGAPIVTSNCEVLGVFAMFDTEPRESFTMANRRKLMDFARLAMVEFEFLLEENDCSSKHKAVKRNTCSQLSMSRGNISKTPFLSTAERESVRARLFQNIEHDAETMKGKGTPLTTSRLIDIKRKSLPTAISVARQKHETSVVGSIPNGYPSLHLSTSVPSHSSTLVTIGHSSLSTVWMNVPTRPTTASSTGKRDEQSEKHTLSEESGNERNLCHPSSNLHKASRYFLSGSNGVTDFAISLIARSLSFDLVYLLRVGPIRSDIVDSELTGNGLYTQVLASHGMPQPEPIFDGSLHFRALRSDGGLVYSNQNKTSKDGGCGYQLGILLPLYREDGTFETREGTHENGADTMATLAVSGMITPNTRSRGGVVLCAFTRTTLKSSTFSPEEVRLFREFAGALRDILFGSGS